MKTVLLNVSLVLKHDYTVNIKPIDLEFKLCWAQKKSLSNVILYLQSFQKHNLKTNIASVHEKRSL